MVPQLRFDSSVRYVCQISVSFRTAQNHIEYAYGPNRRKKQIIHMIICRETWKEVAKDSAEIEAKTSRHVWISHKPFSKDDIHKRFNLCARHRWDIESCILVEKQPGYCYKHAFSYNWNVMKGYHYLMRLGNFINVVSHLQNAN